MIDKLLITTVNTVPSTLFSFSTLNKHILLILEFNVKQISAQSAKLLLIGSFTC